MCATENFTNRYTSLNFNKSVAFSSLYHYRFVFPLYVCATKNVPNRYIPNDLRYIYTFSMLPPSKIRPYLFFYRFLSNIVSPFSIQWATAFRWKMLQSIQDVVCVWFQKKRKFLHNRFRCNLFYFSSVVDVIVLDLGVVALLIVL